MLAQSVARKGSVRLAAAVEAVAGLLPDADVLLGPGPTPVAPARLDGLDAELPDGGLILDPGLHLPDGAYTALVSAELSMPTGSRGPLQ